MVLGTVSLSYSMLVSVSLEANASFVRKRTFPPIVMKKHVVLLVLGGVHFVNLDPDGASRAN